MTIELRMLVYAVVLLMVLILIQAAIGIRAYGATTLAGPRDNLPPPPPLAARAKRVVDNHREGLTVFAPLVLVAAFMHVSNTWTVLGTQLFFYSRLVHAGLYLFGVPMVRPLVFAVGLVGTIMVVIAILTFHPMPVSAATALG